MSVTTGVNVYEKQSEVLNGRTSKKVANNTYLQRRDERTIALLYHSTDVVTYHADGRIVLNTGGWHTSTTKLRFNESYARLPISSVYANKGVWYVDTGKIETPRKRIFRCWDCRKGWTEEIPADYNVLNAKPMGDCPVCGKRADYASDQTVTVPFADGLTFVPNGEGYRVELDTIGDDPKATQKLRAKVKRFAAGYIAALRAGKVPAPSGGDCFGCQFKTQDGKPAFGSDHIALHIEEKYYVPSLIVRAAEVMGASPAAKSAVAEVWQGVASGWRDHDFVWDQLRKMLGRYVMRQIGLVS